MTNEEINKWLSNLKDDIGKAQHQELWHYAEALDMAIEALSNSQNQTDSEVRTSADDVSATDVIYRQDAVNLHCELCGNKGTYYCEPCPDKEAYRMLPSVQPKSLCNTCRYTNLEWYEEPCDSCTMGGESNHYKPSAQRTGEWICSDDMYETAMCSCCGWDSEEAFVNVNRWEWNFCPNCGADMRGGDTNGSD